MDFPRSCRTDLILESNVVLVSEFFYIIPNENRQKEQHLSFIAVTVHDNGQNMDFPLSCRTDLILESNVVLVSEFFYFIPNENGRKEQHLRFIAVTVHDNGQKRNSPLSCRTDEILESNVVLVSEFFYFIPNENGRKEQHLRFIAVTVHDNGQKRNSPLSCRTDEILESNVVLVSEFFYFIPNENGRKEQHLRFIAVTVHDNGQKRNSPLSCRTDEILESNVVLVSEFFYFIPNENGRKEQHLSFIAVTVHDNGQNMDFPLSCRTDLILESNVVLVSEFFYFIPNENGRKEQHLSFIAVTVHDNGQNMDFPLSCRTDLILESNVVLVSEFFYFIPNENGRKEQHLSFIAVTVHDNCQNMDFPLSCRTDEILESNVVLVSEFSILFQTRIGKRSST